MNNSQPLIVRVITAGVRTNTFGLATTPLALTLGVAPAGFEYSAQWIPWGPGANPLGSTTTGELRLRVGI